MNNQTPDLRAEIEYIVAYRDSSPDSNEPTELITLLKQYDAEDVIDEIMQLIQAHDQAMRERLIARARIDELEKLHTKEVKTFGIKAYQYAEARIAELQATIQEQS